MKIEDFAALMGKTREEVKVIMEQNGILELNLTEKKIKETKDNGNLEIIE